MRARPPVSEMVPKLRDHVTVLMELSLKSSRICPSGSRGACALACTRAAPAVAATADEGVAAAATIPATPGVLVPVLVDGWAATDNPPAPARGAMLGVGGGAVVLPWASPAVVRALLPGCCPATPTPAAPGVGATVARAA